MTSQAHHAAMKALLDSFPILTGSGHDAVRLRGPGDFVQDNYWVLWPSTPDTLTQSRYSERVTANSRATYIFQFRAVAVDATGCALIADTALAIVGQDLAVDGRYVWPIRLDEGNDVDYDPKADLYFCDLAFEVVSDLA
ncbi:hypothetical protein [Microbacterium sp. 77mftsu3.1]|uniref:hypothetical protein n=1 Tax=Microbacterium sp. 77mftsu3.1 TaxID=1761802 RepID=UPI000375BD56|nr:hypothetical protein [Microbacterium sp. 77mftsu3.1]SDG21596.1 hypothetical protein SAMN04488590_0210 [Microbacterium sp. 77mftsu3.1]